MKKLLAGALALVAALLLTWARGLDPSAARDDGRASAPATQAMPDPPVVAERPDHPGPLPDGRPHLDDEPSLHALPPEPRLHRQVTEVITAMDRTGRPPEGVAQGGRRGGRRGVFDNAERRLPVQPGGYYTESDVWPRGRRGRGPERLVFGREGEVFYTADHYRTFVRIR